MLYLCLIYAKHLDRDYPPPLSPSKGGKLMKID
jgi:hypothetical protein